MIQAPSLSALPDIRHAFFTREGGVSEGIYASLNGGTGSRDAPENVRENRARMASALGVAPSHFVTCYQIHSPDVIVATEPWTRENPPRADAIVTRTPGLAIGVTTADCGPILFADAQAGVIGATHAGWKGALLQLSPHRPLGRAGLRPSRQRDRAGEIDSGLRMILFRKPVSTFRDHALDRRRIWRYPKIGR